MTSWNPDSDHRSAGSMPDDSGDGTTTQKIKEDARDAKREAGTRAREQVEAGQHRIADEADTLSDAIDAAASNLDDHDREGLAHYARELSSNLARAAGQLEGRSVDELANDAKSLARNNPALFMLGSIAVGFGLSRFFKASPDRDHEEVDEAFGSGASRNGDSYLADDLSTSASRQPRERDRSHSIPATPAQNNGDGRDMP